MQNELEFGVVFRADTKQLAPAANAASRDIDKVKVSARAAANDVRALGVASTATARAEAGLAKSGTTAAASQARLAVASKAADVALDATGRKAGPLGKALDGVGVGAGRAGAGARALAVDAAAGAGGLQSVMGAAAGLPPPLMAAAAAVLAVAGAFAFGIKAAIDFNKENDSLTASILRGGKAGVHTSGELKQSASDIARDTGASYDAVRDSLASLTASGDYSIAVTRDMATAAAELADMFQIDVADATGLVREAFDELGKGGTESLIENFKFLDNQTLQTIDRLVATGKTAEAQKLFLAELAEQAAGGPGSTMGAFSDLAGGLYDYIGAQVAANNKVIIGTALMRALGQSAREAAADVRDAANASANVKKDMYVPGGPSVLTLGITNLNPGPGYQSEASKTAGIPKARKVPTGGGRTPRRSGGGGPRKSAAKADPFERLDDQVDRLRDSFSDVPGDVKRAEKALEELAEVGKKIEKLKGPKYDTLRAELAAIKPLIQESLARPIRDMLKDQEREITLMQLRATGRREEADAVAREYALMDKMGAESEDQLATALNKRGITVDEYRQLNRNYDAMRKITEEEVRRNARISERLAILANVRGAFDEVAVNLPNTGVVKGAANLAGNIQSQFDQAFGKDLINKIFGGAFDQLEEELSGKKALIKAEGTLASASARTATKLEALGNAAAAAADIASGTPGATPPTTDAADAEQILVTANKSTSGVFEKIFGGLFDKYLGDGAGKKAASYLAQALEGSFIGRAAASSILGSKGSKTGAALGGAAGNILGKSLAETLGKTLGPLAGPLGSIVGGLVGGALGGLVKKNKTGSASLSNDGGQLGVGNIGGNNKGQQDLASGLAKTVIGDLDSIANQLGGFLSGKPSVSIGFRNGKPVVDTTGQGRTKGAGVTKFKKGEEEAARAFALADALSDGLISGISENVRKAITGNKDIEAGLREALKVDEIEQMLAGLGGANRRAFVDFERQAKERERIARKYGFDLIKIEELNASQRNKLFENSVQNAVGSLKSLLEDLTIGARAPGTLLDRRQSLLAEKARLEPLAANNADAANKLAEILNQLEQVSLEAFGTAGAEYAGDRAAITSTAQRIIDQATAEIRAAQDKARSAAKGDTIDATTIAVQASNGFLGQIGENTDEAVAKAAQLQVTMDKILQTLQTQPNRGFDAAFAIGSNIL